MSGTQKGYKLGHGYDASRPWTDLKETNLLRDVAFNRHSMNDGHHVSPYDNGRIQVGADGIVVKLVQGINEENFKQTLSQAQRATIGIDLLGEDEDFSDWEEMLEGGLQTALETQVIVFAVQGVTRTCTHQIVRSRRASFHQQSQRASYYGDLPEARMPESIWRNLKARALYVEAIKAAHDAYRFACEEDISYQDARYILPESTTNYIMCEYTVREFMNVFAYRGCSMFSWEIVHVAREMRRLLVEAHPWLEPYIKISCEKTGSVCPDCDGEGSTVDRSEFEDCEGEECSTCKGSGKVGQKCTFQGWEQVEGQCDFPQAKESQRTFVSKRHQIKRALPQIDTGPAVRLHKEAQYFDDRIREINKEKLGTPNRPSLDTTE